MSNTFPYDMNALLSGGDRNIFHISLKDYRVLTVDQLYGQHKKLIRDVIEELDSRLYIISRIPKMRFIVDRCRIGMRLNVVGRMVLGNGRARKFNARMTRLWHEEPELHNAFLTERHLAKYYLDKCADSSYFSFLPASFKYRLFSYIYRDKSNASKLVLKCVLGYAIAGFQKFEGELLPYRVANLCDLDIGKYPEVLYIGISNKGMFRRITNHKKLQEILAVNDDNHDILIHFLTLEDSDILYKAEEGNLFVLTQRTQSKISRSNQTDLAETALIKYFSPRFNEKKTKTELSRNEKVKEQLIKKGYTEIYCELNSEGF